jgi:hypothetical protein
MLMLKIIVKCTKKDAKLDTVQLNSGQEIEIRQRCLLPPTVEQKTQAF